jgi:hypothetical protein
MLGELRLVIRLKEHADHFLQQFVRPRRQTKWALLPRRTFLGDVDAPRGFPSEALIAQRFDDRLYLAQAHAVHGLRGDAGSHRTVVAVDLPVGDQVQLWVEQTSVETFQRQTSPAAFTDDPQYGFGVSHLAYLTIPVDLIDTCATSPM